MKPTDTEAREYHFWLLTLNEYWRENYQGVGHSWQLRNEVISCCTPAEYLLNSLRSIIILRGPQTQAGQYRVLQNVVLVQAVEITQAQYEELGKVLKAAA